ncbi:30S ribosomal protein S18 [Helcococcus kunzii]|uniref:Small ribosomal subunit protein bS18 n=1 Tax=Helcococcus kunzii ATCC 51366 TaxID=883114 RepID=H3NL42_9FIRM|nr:30S ribosomal protein S18 [Helcococcus kunzii]EHR36298.1 ribosomal protein S18 [Helcococcus kunzii ATCC 51366]MCT1796542.1 30S ribosomal protein S18 [Helcococcus kunzii]MCT1989633.1 30S ribosomal protein S18 [Helcococcus kunzii]QUY63989.1 30S ribosomal protein S18 [Helcococcus kunzii]QZO76457.1 30S ribosomal protein S18 [Helcococcus kunzii]
MARKFRQRKKVLDQEKVKRIDYKDANSLKSFISERGKILPRRVTGANAEQQRIIAKNVKRARQIAILPYQVN